MTLDKVECERVYDFVVVGATGHTGRFVVECIARHYPRNLRWAVCGRDEGKLHLLLAQCKTVRPTLEVVDAEDYSQALGLAKKTFMLITTVGPYCVLGEALLRACAESGTHYLDCSAEPPWIANMISKYDGVAARSGAVMIPEFGILSAAELCTWSLATRAYKHNGLPIKDAVIMIERLSGRLSPGSIATVLSMFDRYRLDEIWRADAHWASSVGAFSGQQGPRQSPSLAQRLFGVSSVPLLGRGTTSLVGISGKALVARSWAAMTQRMSDEPWFPGSDLSWAAYGKAGSWLGGVATHWAFVLGSYLLAYVSPLRRLLRKLVSRATRDGPDGETDEIEYRGVAGMEAPVGWLAQPKQVYCQAVFHGSLYYLTALLLSQGALTMLEEGVRLSGGFHTPSSLGQGYVDRLADSGLKIETAVLPRE